MSKTILVIAGHGEKKNGGFDPGATGYIAKGEHKYYEEDFFPAMRKYLPKDSNVVLFSAHNVFSYKDLASLAKKHGNDTIVVEMHYDAASAAATGGHVIVHANYAPDSLDLKIRDVIKKHIGVRYNHKGHVGISGRSNLQNCNIAAQNGINYRLVELGFCTNKTDVDKMVKNVEAIAKDFVEALVGVSNDKPVEVKPIPKPVVSKPATKPTETSNYNGNSIVDYLTSLKMDSSPDNRRKLAVEYGVANYDLSGAKNLGLLNAMRSGKKAAVSSSKTVDQLVNEVLAGKHGDGDVRKKNLGANYDAVQAVINGAPGTTSKPIATAIKVGDKVTASKLYGSGADTSPDRTISIYGYVEKINNSWKNPYRLERNKGKKDYLGFARKADLKK